MKIYTRYFLVWIVNSFVFLLANNYFPSSYVLGNSVISPVTAAFLNGFLLSFAMRIAKGIIKEAISGRYLKFVFYFLANSVSIWLLARFSAIFGFGIPAFVWAFYLGFVTSLVQWVLRQAFKKFDLV